MDYLERSKSRIEARTANNCKRMQKAAKDVQKAAKDVQKAAKGVQKAVKGAEKAREQRNVQNPQERERRNHDLRTYSYVGECGGLL